MTAGDVAMKVNKMKRLHQSSSPLDRKRIERNAWREINLLTEAQILSADGKAVALLLNAWAYFAKYWENGKDGPNLQQPIPEEAPASPPQGGTPPPAS
jgi:hypothetical protein